MKAPDKIYLNRRHPEPYWFKDKQLDSDVEYIRKDALRFLKSHWKPSEEQDYSDLSDLERAIHRGFLCAGVENVPVAIIKETAKECLELAKKELARRDEVITLDNLPPYDKGFQDGKAEAMTELERTFECNQDKLPIWLKNELAKKHLDGYIMGREDTMRDIMDFVESKFHSKKAKEFDTPTINIPTWEPPCYNGGPCTNPQMDCINCPRKTTGGVFSTLSGTSTLKAEG